MKLFLEKHRLYPQGDFTNSALSPHQSDSLFYITFLANPIIAIH